MYTVHCTLYSVHCRLSVVKCKLTAFLAESHLGPSLTMMSSFIPGSQNFWLNSTSMEHYLSINQALIPHWIGQTSHWILLTKYWTLQNEYHTFHTKYCILDRVRKHHLWWNNFYHPFSCSIWSNLSVFFGKFFRPFFLLLRLTFWP